MLMARTVNGSIEESKPSFWMITHPPTTAGAVPGCPAAA